LLKDIDGVRVVGHGGSTIGQYSAFQMVPERGFAFASMTNCGPNGPQFNRQLERWVFEHFLSLVDEEPEPVDVPAARLVDYVGHYETIAAVVDVTADGGRLVAQVAMKPETKARLTEEGGEPPPDQPPVVLGLLYADGDQYVVAEGDAKGMTGYFARGADGTVTGVHMGGRLATRVDG
jgi:hypothetical protein